MTSNLLFRRLTSGITFDTKKFSKEASKFGLTKPDTDVKLEEKGHPVLPSIEDVKREIKEKLEKEKQLHVSDALRKCEGQYISTSPYIYMISTVSI